MTDHVRSVPLPTPDDLARARRTVRDTLRPTPLRAIGNNVLLKLETEQPTGSFKVRGALAALSRAGTDEQIVTASAGNHALGMAWASQRLGVPVTIVVATNASPLKVVKLQDMGADLVLHGQSYDDAEAHAMGLAAEGARLVSGYNDPFVVAGQATILDELLKQIKSDFTLIVPTGGGGLIAGLALRASAIDDRHIRLIAVETESSRAMSTALAAGEVVHVDVAPTLADGLAGNMEPGAITLAILQQHPVEFVAVRESEIVDAIRTLHDKFDLTVEGSAAAGFAALKQIEATGPIVVILTGRNIARDVLDRILTLDDDPAPQS